MLSGGSESAEAGGDAAAAAAEVEQRLHDAMRVLKDVAQTVITLAEVANKVPFHKSLNVQRAQAAAEVLLSDRAAAFADIADEYSNALDAVED